ncbi:MAG: hypothetical protein IPG07_21460 [Crocinitomicaceae bacterium]|nr:hypothetical protein [Crocinitomicaceae bacterium]
MTEYAPLKWREISTGYRLRFQLAKMLLINTELLVLDEPIANLDINAQGKFLSDLRNIVSEKKRKVSVILSSQQLHEIENVADSIVFLKKGEMIYSGVVGKIGETRTDNEFEIQTSLTDADLKSIFPDIVLNLNGKTLHVKVPLNITAEKFITELIQKAELFITSVTSVHQPADCLTINFKAMKLFKKLDNYLLHHYPSIWITRIHSFLPIGVGIAGLLYLITLTIGWSPKDEMPQDLIPIVLMIIPVLIYLVPF